MRKNNDYFARILKVC